MHKPLFILLLFISQFSIAQDTLQILPEVNLYGTRSDLSFKTTFQTIKMKEVEAINLGQDVPILLQSLPSLTFSTDAGNGIGYTNLRIRGTDQTRINVTINGVPYNDAESQGVYWVDIADILSSAKDVQVQRGLGTSTIGAGAFGGNININTIKSAEKASLEINNSIGSFNTVKNSLLFNTGNINKIFELSGRLTRITSDGYMERATSKLSSGNLNWKIKKNNFLIHTMYFFGYENTYQAWNGVSEVDLLTNRRKNIAGTDFETKTGKQYHNEVDDYQQHNFQVVYNQKINAAFSTSLTAHYTKGKGFYEEYKVNKNLQSYGLDSPTITDLIRQRWLNNDFYGAIFNVNYYAHQWNIVLSNAWNQYDGDHYGNIIQTISTNAVNLPHTYYNNKGIKTEYTSFIKISKTINRWSGFVDLQYRNVGYQIVGTENELQNLQNNYQFQFFNPKFGLQYKVNSHTNLNAYIGYGHKEPDRTDFINDKNNNPKYEEMLNTELGYQYNKNKIQLQANAFGMFYTNQLILTGAINDVGNYIRANVPKSYRAGLELEAKFPMGKYLSFNGNFTWSVNKTVEFTNTTYTYDDQYNTVDSLILRENLKSKDIAFSPNYIGYGELSFNPIPSLSIALQHKLVSKQYLDNTQSETKKLDLYQVDNISIAYTTHFKVVKDVKIFLLLNNIFDIAYVSNGYTFESGRTVDQTGLINPSTSYNYYFPQAQFNFLLGLNLKF